MKAFRQSRWVNRPAAPRRTRLVLNRLEDRAVPAVTLMIQPVSIGPVEGQQFNGTVATFTDSNPAAVTADFIATINFGDGTSPVTVTGTAGPNGQIVADSVVPGQFDIEGIHTYADEGHFNVVVTVTDTPGGGSATTGSY